MQKQVRLISAADQCDCCNMTSLLPSLALSALHRWPVGVKEWKERTKRIHKPIHLKTLGV